MGFKSTIRWWWCSLCSSHRIKDIQNCIRCRAGHWICIKHNEIECDECDKSQTA